VGAELECITGLDMRAFGFVLPGDEPEAEDDNFDIDEALKQPPIAKPGMIWRMGDHRLMCGSATERQDVALLMGDVRADLIVTDPPYNVDYEGGTKDKLKIANDRMKSDAFRAFLLAAFQNAHAFCRGGAAAYVFHADTEGYNFRGAFCEAGFRLAQTCIWVKNSMVLGRQDYQWQHEPVMCGEKDDGDEWQPVLYGWNPLDKHAWHSNRKQKTVWYFDKPNRSAQHPTMKPVPLVGYPIKNSSAPGNIVLDLFGGSGSTLIACEQLGRRCHMMELDPVYCDVIIRRWQALTDRKAETIMGGEDD